jgi:hypothetical protein
MTNILSILEKVNGGGRGVYGDWEKLGGFRGKRDFLLRSAECGVRNLGGYLFVAGFCGLAAGHRPAVRGRVDTGLEKPVDPQTGKSALRERGFGGSLVGFEVGSAAGRRAVGQGQLGNIEDNVDAQGGTSGAKMTRCYSLVPRMHGRALRGPASEVLADGHSCGRPSLGRETAQRARLCVEEDARMGTASRKRRPTGEGKSALKCN